LPWPWPVSLPAPYLGGRARTAEAVASNERAVLCQNIVNVSYFSGQQSCLNLAPCDLYTHGRAACFPPWPLRLGTLGKTVLLDFSISNARNNVSVDQEQPCSKTDHHPVTSVRRDRFSHSMFRDCWKNLLEQLSSRFLSIIQRRRDQDESTFVSRFMRANRSGSPGIQPSMRSTELRTRRAGCRLGKNCNRTSKLARSKDRK
jgi:hypothetical protein